MFRIVAVNAMCVYVYSLDGTLVNSFSLQVAAANWLNVSRFTVSRYIKSGKVIQGKCIIKVNKEN